MLRRWGLGGALLVVGVVVAVDTVAPRTAGAVTTAAVLLLFFLALGLVTTPLPFPNRMSADEAARRSAVDGRPVVYWRVGCQFCLRLRLRLGRRAREAYWVDIWADPDAAAIVRGIADGNETVPTVVAGSQRRVNPDPSWVLQQLHS